MAPPHLSAAFRWVLTRRFAALLVGISFLTLSASSLAVHRVVTFPAVPQPLVCLLRVANAHQQNVVTSLSSTIECTVTRANPSDTLFSLQYHLVTPDGASNRFTVICNGTLAHGRGSCSRTFGVPYGFAPGNSWVAGSTLPSGNKLGPVVSVPVLPTVTS
jgi:hypothetical protein